MQNCGFKAVEILWLSNMQVGLWGIKYFSVYQYIAGIWDNLLIEKDSNSSNFRYKKVGGFDVK